MREIDKIRSLELVIAELRPAMQVDGGDVEIVSIEGGVVTVQLRGTCLTCPSASLTLKHGIEKTLKERCSWVTEVVQAAELAPEY